MKTIRRVAGWLDLQLQTDARSLAVGRFAIGLLLLYDLVGRERDLQAHYSDSGALPRAIFHLPDWSFTWSLHALGGSVAFEAVLFGLAGLAGLAFTIGFWTRTATLSCFLLALSVQGRDPFLHDGQDDLLRVVLFFSLWLPLGRAWSVDARAARPLPGEPPTFQVGGLRALGLVGQITIVYLSSVIGKLQSPWWTHGDGILRALQLGRYETSLGQQLARFPSLLRPLSFLVLVVELLLPLLLWIPWRRGALRLLAVCLAIGLHLSFGLFLRLSIFPLLSVATWVLLLPSWVWGRGPSASSETTDLRGAGVALAALLLAALYVVGTHRRAPILPDWARRLVETVGLQQYWVVFAPREGAGVTDGFFVAAGQEPDGQLVDGFDQDRPVTYARPALISETFADTRWRHFYANLVVDWARGSAQWREILAVREATAVWLCRDHARRHPDRPPLLRLSLYFVEHAVERPEEPPRRRLLAQVVCPQ